MNSSTFRSVWMSLVALAALAMAPVAVAQQGTISGRVTDQATGQPLVGARATIVGTALIVQTNAEGRYVLANVKAGVATLRVGAVGYGTTARSVTIVAGETLTEDVTLTVQAFSLDAVVVTATGEQAIKEMGNAVSTLAIDSLVQRSPTLDLNDALTSRTPGVSVFESPITGAEARVRIRGASSLSLSNEPVYYIDGIRMESATGSSSIGIGGTDPSRVNDINPDEIESLEVVRGPAAATLYGTDAANGVIVIRTKRGRAGPPRWTVYGEAGTITDHNQWPTAYRAWRTGGVSGTTSVPTNGVQCLLSQVASGTCTQDSVSHYNLFEDKSATPLGTGWRGQTGVQVSGGTDQVRYFLSGEYEDEIGLLKVADFGYSRFTNRWHVSEMPYEYYRPNARERISLRANVDANLSSMFDVQASVGYITSNQRLPQTDNNTTGLLSNAFGGPGHRDNWRFSPDTLMLYGHRAFTPDEMFAEVVSQDINRFIGSGTVNFHPNAWLTGRAIVGVDYTSRVDQALCKLQECTPFGNDTLGRKEDNRTGFNDITFDANMSATYPINPSWRGKTTVGVQYFDASFARNGAFGEGLPPGSTTVSPGGRLLADEASTLTKTLGAYVEQHVGFRERLFFTAGLRGDDNSAFGQDFGASFYPKFSVSYVMSDEAYLNISWLSQLRLRGAIGASGQQPGSTDATPFYAPTPSQQDAAPRPAVVFSSVGNPKLKPERAQEIELGFDAGAFDNRVNVMFTWYTKHSKDALIEIPVAPSVGASNTRFENLGAVRNSGVEFSVNAILLQGGPLDWDATLNFSHNTNVIEDLGGLPPIVGTTIQQREGYPVDGYWQRPILGYRDLNGDGIIAASEVFVGDSAQFVGPSLAPTEMSFATGVNLFGRRLRVSSLFDYKGGRWQLNGTERIRCESRLNCDAEIDPNTSPWKQARVAALKDHPSRTQWGFFEPADAVRWRELAVTYDFPGRIARVVGASGGSFTVAARNLARWSNYTGLDPESGYVDAGNQTDFQTQAPPRYLIARLNLTF